MTGKKRRKNPVAFIAVGVCFMGAGVALSIAQHATDASGVGTGIIGLGVIFFIVGIARKRKVESGEPGVDDKAQQQATRK